MGNQEKKICGRCVNLILINITAISADLLRCAFEGEDSIQIVGCASTAEELQSILSEQSPDVALIGARGWKQGASVLPLLEQVTATAPTIRQIVISTDMSKEDAVSFFRCGARGLLCESQVDVRLLLKCIRCVSIGQIWANSEQLDQLVRSLSLPRSLKVTNVVGDSLLSNREEQVLHLLVDGLSNRELAATLKLSEHTVKNHLFRIFDKLGVSNRMEAVLYAISQREQRGASTSYGQGASVEHVTPEITISRSPIRHQ